MRLKINTSAKLTGLSDALENHFPTLKKNSVKCLCGDTLAGHIEWAHHVAEEWEDPGIVVANFVLDEHGIRQEGDAILDAHPQYNVDDYDNGYDVEITVKVLED